MAKRGGINVATKRLMKELEMLKKDPVPLIAAEVANGDIQRWIATIEGPPGTPYADGKFRLSLRFPADYPFAPPDVKFITQIYHANIDSRGFFCLDILGYQWSPAITVQKLLLSICSLLSDCYPDSPLRPSIAALYMENKEEYDRRAREFTRKFAM